MARKKGAKASEESRGLADGRYINPLDRRIQEKGIEKTTKRLRKG